MLPCVPALFRVLRMTNSFDGCTVVELAPTLQTRDGQPCEINRQFWQATPSGSCKLTFGAAAHVDALKPFRPGAYVRLDFRKRDADGRADPATEGAIRTEWRLDKLEIESHAFTVRLSPIWSSASKLNTSVFGGGYAAVELEMRISNLAIFPFFAFEPGGGDKLPAPLFVDFIPA